MHRCQTDNHSNFLFEYVESTLHSGPKAAEISFWAIFHVFDALTL